MHHIISDIHGCFFTLQKLIEKVRAVDPDAIFIGIGDYQDRGKWNKEVLDLIIAMEKEGKFIPLRGNHDNVIDYIVNDHYLGNIRDMLSYPSHERAVDWWMHNGLASTLVSYGVDPDLRALEVVKQFREAMPEEHRQFIKSLKMLWSNKTHFCCHAYYRPTEELPITDRFLKPSQIDEMLWSRFARHPLDYNLIPVTTVWDKIGVFGHTPTTIYNSPVPVVYDKIRLIDTGCFTKNYLCAFCTETDDYILQSTDSADI